MKKLMTALLALSLVLACAAPVVAASVSDFKDVKPGDWFYDAVSFVTEKGMFNGTGAATFSPDMTMERGMFVTVLGRYGRVSTSVPEENSGVVSKTDVRMRSAPTTKSDIVASPAKGSKVEILDLVKGTDDPSYMWYYVNYNGTGGYIREDLINAVVAEFVDVPSGEYYAGYVYWAYNTGIAGKTGEDTFSPTRAITREEICAMAYNFASIRNLELAATIPAASFTDSQSITADYAAAVSAMQKAGVINGYPDGSFRPKNSATRAEVSTLLKRFVDCVSYKPTIEPSYDAAGNYIWGAQVPQKAQVSAAYFSDACFIGHSLVVGMESTFGLENADFYAYTGAAARTLLSYDKFTLPNKATGTLAEGLGANSYGKVYIMLGANEIGTDSSHLSGFYTSMSAIIALVRQTQPNARIYLFSFTPVSQFCSETRPELSRDNIIRYNETIKQLCRNEKLFYLNVFDLLANTDGFLPEEACASDGIHLLASEYFKIKTYVFTHTA